MKNLLKKTIKASLVAGIFVGIWAQASLSDYFYVEGQVLSFDSNKIELQNGAHKLKVKTKDIAEAAKLNLKLGQYVYLKVSTKAFLNQK